ncbi:ADPR responsive transcriptional repressor NtrR [Acinetobacter larvae]|uniref:NUDIX hydrolase n=1 Tax=Acinetobacter larvae TaxID=1789224 RepID=A0A1B2M436_9GAMM|nr:NUDIX domain-containing protein [Acinetobacter larvae]AOA59934.1 NUDIX hydrolase [Acinetobacter larvae]
MSFTSEQEYLSQYQATDYPSPLMTVDMAIFALNAGQLQILLIKRSNYPAKDHWALPGGFVDLKQDQDLMASAKRKLLQKTGVDSPYLEQVVSIGNAQRDPRGWSITVLYFALIDFNTVIQHNDHLEYSEWVNLTDAQDLDLAFDHAQLLQLAFERLQNKTRYTTLPIRLMPDLFTLTELQRIYEIILGQSLEKKSFRRRMIESGVVEQTAQHKIAGKRPAQLYRFALQQYDFHFPRMLEYPRPNTNAIE